MTCSPVTVLRIIDGMIKAFPVVGVWMSYLFFGDEFPGVDVIQRLYVLHIMLLPAIFNCHTCHSHGVAHREQAHPVRGSRKNQ